MRFSAPVYSTIYASAECGEWCARPTTRFLQMLHEIGQDSARWILVIGGVDFAGGARGVAVALGDPIADTRQAAVYVPQWILDASSEERIGQGEITSFECIAAESLPRASRLGFRVIGDLPEDVDVRELLEGALSQLGVLTLGQMIPVPAFENCVLMVEVCEPAERVFLEGAEVALEIERDEAPVTAAVAAAAPPPPAPGVVASQPATDFFSTGMVPVEEASAALAQTQGNRLGGGGSGRSRLLK